MMSRRTALGLIGLATAATAVGVSAAARSQAKTAEAAYPPLGAFLNVDAVPVHYVQRGTGPDLILLHGAGGNLRDFTFRFMDLLTDRYRVTAFDRPGLGYTGRVPGTATGVFATTAESPLEQAAFLRKAAAQLGIVRPIVAGQSFGGAVAYAWAVGGLDADTPENAAAVVSLSGVTLPWPGDLGAYYRVNGSAFGGAVTVPLLAALVPDRIVRDRIASAFTPESMPDGYADYIGAALTLRPDTLRANVRQVNTLRPHMVTMETRYGDLTLPVEIVHGTADTTVPIDIHARPFAQRYAIAALTELPGVGHMPHHSRAADCVAAIDRAANRAGLR